MKFGKASTTLLRHGAKAATAVLVLGVSSLAQASAVVWTLSDASFLDGGAVTGFFTYDADTDTFGDFSLSVSGGDTTTFPAFVYTPDTVSGSPFVGQPIPGDFNIFFETAGDPFSQTFTERPRQLRLPLVSLPTSAGGTIQFNLDSAFGAECYTCDPFRLFASGSITSGGGGGGTPVIPEPATWAMMIAGFGLVGGVMRRRREEPAA